jgi:hypothetical protein
MMVEKGFTRRIFLRLASAVPFALTLGWGRESHAATKAEDALRILILALGPWRLGFFSGAGRDPR